MNQRHDYCRFALLRHAQTHWNVAKRIQGRQNSDLTDYGRRQAANFAARIQSFGFTAVLCSDLGRARHTAKIINARLKLPLFQDQGLREQDWGRWEGKTLRAIQQEEGEYLARQVASGWNFRPPGGEDRRTVFERGRRVLETWAAQSGHAATLVITHGGMLKCLIYGLAGRRFLPSEPAVILPEHLHWVAWNGGGLQIEKLNALKTVQQASSEPVR